MSNKGYALTNIIDGDASSACEVICRLLDMEKVSRDAASALYMGIAHDTGVFQYSCTSPETMRLAADFDGEADPVYGDPGGDFLQEDLSSEPGNGKSIAGKHASLKWQMHCQCHAAERYGFLWSNHHGSGGIVSQMKQTKGIEVAIFLYETDYMEYKVSLRSENIVDVSKVASYFGGGGHVRAAGVTMKGTFHDIVNNLTLHIERQLEGQED